MNKKPTNNRQSPDAAPQHQARHVLERLARPAREVHLLKPDERRLAITVLLAALVPADRKIREVEIERLIDISVEHYRVPAPAIETLKDIAICKRFTVEELTQISLLVPEILNIQDRLQLIGLLWEIALCDRELHALEEETIFVIAEKLEVPRKKAIEQQARALNRR